MKNIKFLVIAAVFLIHDFHGAAAAQRPAIGATGAVIKRLPPATVGALRSPYAPQTHLPTSSSIARPRPKSTSPVPLLSRQEREFPTAERSENSRLDQALANLGKNRNSTSFEILSVPDDATRETIMNAYRTLVKEHHPDVNPSNTTAQEEFVIITQAKNAAIKGDPTMPFNLTGTSPSSSPTSFIATQAQLPAPSAAENEPPAALVPMKYPSFFNVPPPGSQLVRPLSSAKPPMRPISALEPDQEDIENQLYPSSGSEFKIADEMYSACRAITLLNNFCTLTSVIDNQLKKFPKEIPAKVANNNPSNLCKTVGTMREFCRVKGYVHESEHVRQTQGADILTKERMKERIGEAGGLAFKHHQRAFSARKPQQLVSNPQTQTLISDFVLKAMASTPVITKPLLPKRGFIKPAKDVFLLKELLDLDLLADINAPDPEYGSLLSYAVSQNNINMVKLLIEKGADPNRADGKDKRPIEYALESPTADPALIRYLVDKMISEYQTNDALRTLHESIAVPETKQIFIEALDKEPYREN